MNMYKKLEGTVKALKTAGVDVIREKIECIIYDTKVRS